MYYLAEFYLPGHNADLAGLAERARNAAEQVSRSGEPVRFIEAIHASEDENCFVIYEAGIPAVVVTAGVLAGLTFDRIVEVTTQPAHDDAVTSHNRSH